MVGLWFSPSTPVSSTKKTDRKDITEILLTVALNTGFQAGPYFPNFPYFLTAALIFFIKASKS